MSNISESHLEQNPELSVIIPCLNEEETIERCITKIKKVFNELSIFGEIIVVDNGSTDRSAIISRELGARVLNETLRGYGSALSLGIASARSDLIIMADADDSYDFLEIPKFYYKLKEDYDFVQGCRLPKGGGVILPSAMPISHRIIGNPFFTYIGRKWFKAPINDIYCGFRGFNKGSIDKLNLKCRGMEFAVEMIVKASAAKLSITEVPITLHPDGRIKTSPHLRTLRDGWRTLRFLLMICPEKLFFFPGVLLILFGIIAYIISYPGYTLGGVTFDAHSLLFASLSI